LQKRENIRKLEQQLKEPLIMQPPDVNLLFMLEELGYLLSDFIGLKSPTDDEGRILDVRHKGMWFEFQIAQRLGYSKVAKGGSFPDLRHQLIEAKHHVGKKITIDFGRHHPGSKDVVPGSWNVKLGVKENEIRYIIALAPPPEYQITSMIICTGAQIMNSFGVPLTQTIKYQMGIPEKWRSENTGKVIVGTEIYNDETNST